MTNPNHTIIAEARSRLVTPEVVGREHLSQVAGIAEGPLDATAGVPGPLPPERPGSIASLPPLGSAGSIVPRPLWQRAREAYRDAAWWLTPEELIEEVTEDPERRALMAREWALYEGCDAADVLDQLCLCVVCERDEAAAGQSLCDECLGPA